MTEYENRKRYLIVEGGADDGYNLVTQATWDQLPAKERDDWRGNFESQIEEAAMRSVGLSSDESHRRISETWVSSPHPDNPTAFFVQAWEVHAFCRQHCLHVVGGLG